MFPSLSRNRLAVEKARQTATDQAEEGLAQGSETRASQVAAKERAQDGLQAQPVHSPRDPPGGAAAPHAVNWDGILSLIAIHEKKNLLRVHWFSAK